MVMFKALAASALLLTTIVADHNDFDNAGDDFNGDNSIDWGKIERQASKAIQGVRDLRQGRLKKGLREKIEEIAAEIAEQKIAEALANFIAPIPPVASTQKPFFSSTQAPVFNPTGSGVFPITGGPNGDETSGVFTSPNYPDNYPLGIRQIYYLGIPNEKFAKFGGQYAGISLTFKDFEIEGPSGWCPYDSLKLFQFNSRKRRDHDSFDFVDQGNFTDPSDYVPPTFDPAVEYALFDDPLCGKFNDTTRVQTNVTYNLPLSYIEFEFEADNYISHKGFAIEWSFIEKEAFFAPPEPVTVQPVQNATIPLPESPTLPLLYFPVANETSGVITSPNYPNDYGVNQTQKYIISIPYDMSTSCSGQSYCSATQYSGISLTVNDFEIEGEFPDCPYDSLTLTHYNFRKRRDHDSSFTYNYYDGSGDADENGSGSGNFTDYPDYTQFENLVDPEIEAAFFSGPLCGNAESSWDFQNAPINLPFKLDLNLNFIQLEFKSDYMMNYKGFEIEWSFIENDAELE